MICPFCGYELEGSMIEWIPVDLEELPDMYETVLIYIESEPEGYITLGIYNRLEIRWTDYCANDGYIAQGDVVTHWAHLPSYPTKTEKEYWDD